MKNNDLEKGYLIRQQLLPTNLLKIILDKVKHYESKGIKQNIFDEKPFVNIFVAGFPDDQFIINIDEFQEIKQLLNIIKLDIEKLFKTNKLYVYEITIFKKKKGSPSLTLHQDSWYHPFKLSDNLYEYFTYYLPLTKFDDHSSQLGIIDINEVDLKKKYKEKHIISGLDLKETINIKKESLPVDNINYLNMEIGDALIFEIRTPHNSKEQKLGIDDRYALSIRFANTNPIIQNLNSSRAKFVEQLRKYGLNSFIKLK